MCKTTISEGVVCSECNERLWGIVCKRKRNFEVNGRVVEGTYLFDYDNPDVKQLLFALKHYADRELFEYASCFYKELIPEGFSGILACCPRSGKGVRNYGYDQVARPLRIICKDDNSNCRFEKLLARRGFSKEQKKLNLYKRRKNTEGKFKVTKKDIHENILLFDDVVTSGSTAKSCAKELMASFPDVNLNFAFLTSRGAFSRK